MFSVRSGIVQKQRNSPYLSNLQSQQICVFSGVTQSPCILPPASAFVEAMKAPPTPQIIAISVPAASVDLLADLRQIIREELASLKIQAPTRSRIDEGEPMASRSPWATRREVATYLRVSVETVDRQLVRLDENPKPVEHKMRYRFMGERRRVRVLKSDVYAMCPRPPED